MNYTRISADCHIDLPWIPPDLFTSNATAALKPRMPFVTDGPDGPYWTSKNGTSFGLMNGVGPAGAKYVPGMGYRISLCTNSMMRASAFCASGEFGCRLMKPSVAPS